MSNAVASRRGFLKGTLAVAAACCLPVDSLLADDAAATQRYRIAACDWMMLKRQTLGAITRARECDCDGVETDMGGLGQRPTFENKFLTDPAFLQNYLELCKQNNIAISSLAMSGYYAQPFAERDYERPVRDCIETMKLLGVNVAFLPLGVRGDLVKYPELRPVIVERLAQCGKWAEEAGVVIGVETALDAAGDVKLLEDIGSPGVKIYFNFANAWQNDRDIHAELKTLGRDRICQIHCTNQDQYWLQDDPKVDMPAIKKTLDELGYAGWLVIERSRRADRGRDVVGNFGTNARYLKSIFQA